MKLKIKTLLIDIWLFKYTLSGTTIYVYINKPIYIYSNYDIKILLKKKKNLEITNDSKSLYRKALILLFNKLILQTVEKVINDSHCL